MTKIFYSESRYGDERWISKESNGSYIVSGKSRYVRCAIDLKNSSHYSMFDYEGGPTFTTSEVLLLPDKCPKDFCPRWGVIQQIIPIPSDEANIASVRLIVSHTGEPMTLPSEELNALKFTRKFLEDLISPTRSKRVPKHIRERARGILRHYPFDCTLDPKWNKDIEDKEYTVKGNSDVAVESVNIDHSELSRHIDYKALADNIETDTLVEEIDYGLLASAILKFLGREADHNNTLFTQGRMK